MGIYVDALMEKNSLYLRFLFAEIINRGKNMGLDVNDFLKLNSMPFNFVR